MLYFKCRYWCSNSIITGFHLISLFIGFHVGLETIPLLLLHSLHLTLIHHWEGTFNLRAIPSHLGTNGDIIRGNLNELSFVNPRSQYYCSHDLIFSIRFSYLGNRFIGSFYYTLPNILRVFIDIDYLVWEFIIITTTLLFIIRIVLPYLGHLDWGGFPHSLIPTHQVVLFGVRKVLFRKFSINAVDQDWVLQGLLHLIC